jgi:putative transposase
MPCRVTDETCIKVKGRWTYLYRAVDLAATRRFFKQAIGTNGVPDRVVIDKSGANLAGLLAVNVILTFTGGGRTIQIR